MAEFKGTPGPWEFMEYGPRGLDGPSCFRIGGPDWGALADTHGYSGADEANARLIAAAPALLNEGERVHRAVDRFYRCCMEFGEDAPSACGEYLDELAQADEALGAVIQKALGSNQEEGR